MSRVPSILLASLFLAATLRSEVQPLPQFAAAQPVAAPTTRPWNVPSGVRLASDGRQFLAVFSDSRFGDQDVLGFRYDERGVPLDPQAFPVRATWRTDSSAVPIGNGSGYAVFSSSEYIGISRVRVSTDGIVTAAAEDLPPSYGFPLDGAWNGSRYCVAFQRFNPWGSLTLRFFDPSLGETDAVDFGSAGEPVLAGAVASDGRTFLAVWETSTSQQNRIYAMIVDEHGTALSSPQTLAAEPNALPDIPMLHPVVSWNGSRYLVAWSSPTTVRGVFVSADGAASDAFAIPATPSPRTAVAAWDGFAHLLIWQEQDTFETKGALVGSTGVLLDQFDFGAKSGSTAAASNANGFFVLSGGDRFFVHSTGPTRLERLGAATTAYLPQSGVSITAGNANLLAAWYEGGGVYSSRISPTGATLDGTGIFVGSGVEYRFDSLSTASAADVHLIAWADGITQTSRAARVTAAGEVLDPGGTPLTGGARAAAGGHALMLAVVEHGDIQTSFAEKLVVQPVPLRGPWPAPATIASGLNIGTEIHALVEIDGGFAILWRKYLSPPCTTSHCTRTQEERLTRIGDDGSIRSDVVVPSLVGTYAPSAVRNGDRILVTDLRTDEAVTRQISFDGSPGPEAVTPLVTSSVYGVKLVPIAGGFQLVVSHNRYSYPTSTYSIGLIRLDPSGHPLTGESTIHDGAALGSVVHAFGSMWLAWMAQWQPLPNAHTGVVLRAFYQPVPDVLPRRRSVPPR